MERMGLLFVLCVEKFALCDVCECVCCMSCSWKEWLCRYV